VKILVVEDEKILREGLVDLLRGAGYTVEAVGDGVAAERRGCDPALDLVLLDLMLPGRDGLEVCRELRRQRPDLFILILTARGAENDKVLGLQAGADDYVTKPFGALELVARVEAMSRRSATAAEVSGDLEADGCRINLGRCVVRRDGRTETLTRREADILRLLYVHRDRAVSRSELLQRVWETPGHLRTRTVDMTIANLRRKVERDPSDPRVVITVKGVGYAWGKT
jgi:two-component system response regulator RegX3